jgi:tetratricopeptide (TPR) repeat protein
MKPDFAEAQYNLGTAYYNREQYKEAATALQQAVRLRPDYADAYNSLGSTLYKAQQFEQAIDAYKKTLSLKPNAETSNNLGTVYFRTKRYQEAASAFKEAIRIKPDYGEAHFNLAVAYVALSDRKGALDEYNNLKTLDPRLADEFFKRFLKK